MSAHSAGAYTATLQVMVNVLKGGGRAPPPSPAWPNFTLMTECTPESRRYYSLYCTLWVGVPGYCGYYLSDHVRQSARTTGARWPISRPHKSKVALCKNTYGLESGQIF